MPQPTQLIGVVERALGIMGFFNAWTPDLSLTEIAQATRSHKSLAAGLIHSLAAKGYLAANSANRMYPQAPIVISRTKVALSSMDLRQTATPNLHQLCDCFNETVNLAIADAGDMVERPHCARGLDKAILTYLESADLQVYVARSGLPLRHCPYKHQLGYVVTIPEDRTGDLC